MAIAQGTTPTHQFVLPFPADVIKTIHIVYAQAGDILFVKCNDSVTMEGNVLSTTLTQSETLRFDCDKIVDIQVRALTNSDEALASDIIRVSVQRCLEEVVLR